MDANLSNSVKGHILLVDDEEPIRVIFGEFLRCDGWKVSTASTAEEAIELINEIGYDILICDIVLPRLNGDAVISHIFQLYSKKVTILVITGLPDDSYEKRLRNDFLIDGYYPKPINKKELLQIVNDVKLSK